MDIKFPVQQLQFWKKLWIHLKIKYRTYSKHSSSMPLGQLVLWLIEYDITVSFYMKLSNLRFLIYLQL